jgi:hypothetical protein
MDMERLTSAIHSLKITPYDGEEHDHDYAAEINKLNEAEKQLLNRLHEFEERKRNSSAAYDGSEYVRDDDVVEINAGGRIIAARRGTLCQLKGTRLEALFCGRWDNMLLRDGNGRVFLDVSGNCFQAIVDFLNEMTISSEEDPSEPPTVHDDGYRQVLAQYLELFGLRVPPQMPDSNIVTQYSQVKLLHKWLNEENDSSCSTSSGGSSEVELSLIYHSSKENNLSNENFHSTCANQGKTLIIIETIEGHIVGGYTNESWSSPEDPTSVGCWSKANKSFLFAIGFGMSSPCKMDLINANCKHAIYNCSQYGAAFGGGCAQCDLKVIGSKVYLNTGHIYERGKSEKLTDGHIFSINEMEVFRVLDVGGAHHTHQQQHNQLGRSPKQKQVKRFTKDINKAINEKWATLRELEAELCSLEESFDDEELFITAFASGERKDIITLNVSGTIMVTKRSTLQVTEDSVLARQFDDTKWTAQGFSNLRVKEWSPEEVSDWVANIAHIPGDVPALFTEHEVSGCELIALNEFGLKDIGVKRAGTICLLLKEIKKLEQIGESMVTLIEHSPYCFGKILDYLRLKRLHDEDIIEEPPHPTVCDNQKNRFEKVVRYYFPGKSSEYILG